MERTFSGPEAGEGAGYAWKGNRKAGQGSMRITGAEVPHRLDIDLVFLKPFKANNTITFGLAAEGDSGSRRPWPKARPGHRSQSSHTPGQGSRAQAGTVRSGGERAPACIRLGQ